MNAVVGISPDQADKKFVIGDSAKIQILIDEKVGENSDVWSFTQNTNGKRWISLGGFVVDTETLKVLPADGKITKLEFRAIVHAKGVADLGNTSIKHNASGKEFPLSGKILTDVTAYKEEVKEVPWTLPTIPVGGWNTPVIIALVLILLAAIFALIRYLLRKYNINPLARTLTPKEKALQDLEALQFYAKKKTTLKLDDWKKFSFELASILRKFSDQNFNIESAELTDREFLDVLRTHAKGQHHVSSVASILSLIDEVRYGTKELDAPLVPSLIQSAKRYVTDSYIAPLKEDNKK